MANISGLTGLAPRDPVRRLAYLNGALNALDAVEHGIAATRADQGAYRLVRREVEDARQELLDAAKMGPR